ncbi:MAG: N-acetyltransferase family protein [Candidatus Hodarchaeales archaeon]
MVESDFIAPTNTEEVMDYPITRKEELNVDYKQETILTYLQMSLDVKDITLEYVEKMRSRLKKPVKVRLASEEDIPALVEIHNWAFLVSGEPYSPLTIDQMKKVYHSNNSKILIATLYGINVGYILIDFAGQNNEVGVISIIGTLPKWRNRNVATSLVVASWEYFKEASVKEIRSEVHPNNPDAYNLFKSFDFVEEGKDIYN